MLGVHDLTLGQILGIINAAIFVINFLVPLSLPIILLGLLQRETHVVTQTAVSWSVVGRCMHSSLWPTILRTDSAATLDANRSALLISAFRIFMLLLVAVAAVVTPLGLYEGVVGQTESSPVAFHQLLDLSDFGSSLRTPPRTAASGAWSRICRATLPVACPNSSNNITYYANATSWGAHYDWYDSRIRTNVVDIFQSGLFNLSPSVSSAFDIQYRSYESELESENGFIIDNGTKPYTKGAYRPFSTFILGRSYVVVEGLIVDMKDGGVGFRKHTAPAHHVYGSSWSEDILFVEPETVCVDTNLTLDFRIAATTEEKEALDTEQDGITDLRLTDRGGFFSLDTAYPAWNPSNSQASPDLWLRAYQAAWTNNALSMAFMNVTSIANITSGLADSLYLNSSVNRTFPLTYPNGNRARSLRGIDPASLQVNTKFGGYLEYTDKGGSNTTIAGNGSQDFVFPSYPPLYPNPSGIQYFICLASNESCMHFDRAGSTCGQSTANTLANITNVASNCGLLYGTPRPRDGSPTLLFTPGSAWTAPIYTCISVVKASIKTVSFRFNSTDSNDLSGLAVETIEEKVYPDEASIPLWAVENTGMKLLYGNPLWGLVSEEASAKLNISTLRREYLYLPGSVGFEGMQFLDNLPGADLASKTLAATYDTRNEASNTYTDYSGRTNPAMSRLWQMHSMTALTSAKILNLIWTDITANLVLGTTGLETNKTTTTRQKRPQVTNYYRRVNYKYVYGIPAFLLLFLTATSLLASAYFSIFGHAKPSAMRSFLQHTSAGRLLVAGDLKDVSNDQSHKIPNGDNSAVENVIADCTEPTKTWIKTVGATKFQLCPERWAQSVEFPEPEVKRNETTAIYVPIRTRNTW